MLAWETISLMRGELFSEVPVVFEDVRFNRATNIPKEGINFLIFATIFIFSFRKKYFNDKIIFVIKATLTLL